MRNIFVFGSNSEGRHGRGSAYTARTKHGAIYGQARGLQGDSYAIVTKDLSKPKSKQLRSVPLLNIDVEVQKFKLFAAKHSNWIFVVMPIGCGLAGYDPEEIAPMFKGASSNVILPNSFLDVLNNGSNNNSSTAISAQENT